MENLDNWKLEVRNNPNMLRIEIIISRGGIMGAYTIDPSDWNILDLHKMHMREIIIYILRQIPRR